MFMSFLGIFFDFCNSDGEVFWKHVSPTSTNRIRYLQTLSDWWKSAGFCFHQVQPTTEDDMFAEPGQHFCGSGRLQEASAMLGGNFLGSRMVQIPWKWLCWTTSLVGKLRFVWCHKSFSKKTTGAYEILLHQVTSCSGAYARDMGVWSLVNNFFLEVPTQGFCRKKGPAEWHEVEMDGNTSATKRKASEEASSLDQLSST